MSWVVRRGSLPAMYLQGAAQWTSVREDAVRFAGRKDADRMAASVRGKGEHHAWAEDLDVPPPAPEPTDPEEGL
jgi:hypothetical protein